MIYLTQKRQKRDLFLFLPEWPASRHRIASVFPSWGGIAEDFRSENAHRQDFCSASHRLFPCLAPSPLTSHRCPHCAIWATQLSTKRLKVTKKGLFEPQKSLLSHFGGSKSLFLVTFESLCRKRKKGKKVSFLSPLGQINDFLLLGLWPPPVSTILGAL